MLVGRDADLDRIGRLLVDARHGATGSLVLTGEPGIGKTALIRETRRSALEAGMSVLDLVCVEAERDLPGAALATLAGGLPGALTELDPPYAAALGGLTSPRPEGSDHLTLAAALLQALTLESAANPLVLLVDDVHWMDTVSAVAVAFAVRRITDDRLVFIAAARSGYQTPLLSAGLPTTELAGIDPASAAALAREVDGSVSAAAAKRLAIATGGNPMWLTEVVAGLTPSQKAGSEPVGVPPPPSEGLHQALASRLQALSADGRRAAVILAAGEGADADEVDRALSVDGLEMDELEATGIACIADRTWRFAHPLLSSTAYHAASPSVRRRAHRLLASACRDPIRSAWHLDRSARGPDADIADRLEEAARLISARFGPGAAAAAFERSAVLTPSGLDPDRYRRLGEAGIAHMVNGRPEHALALCDEVLAATPSRLELPLRTRLGKAKATGQFWSGHPEAAIRFSTTEASELARCDPAAPFDILMLTAFFHCTSGHPADAIAISERLLEVAVTPRQALLANLTVDHMTTVYGHRPPDPAASLWRDQLEAEGPGSELGYLELTQLLIPEIWRGQLERCWDRVAAIESAMRDSGNMLGLPYMLAGRADLAWRLGRYQESEALAFQAEELGELIGDPMGPAMAHPVLIKLAGVKGDAEAARDRLKALGFPGGRTPIRSSDLMLEHAAGVVSLTLGEPATAVDCLRAAGQAAAESGYSSPGFVPWRADLAEALARAGQRSEARAEALTLLEEGRRFHVLASEAAAWNVLAMVAEGEIEAEERFTRALGLYERVTAPFEQARAFLSYGERLRRARRRSDARIPLREAIARFDALPAPVWADRARMELAATGERRASKVAAAGGLTPQELQVAQLLAHPGTTIRDAATKLFLSPRTVEVHLGRVYRKLGVSDRAGLRNVMNPAGPGSQ